MARRQGDAEPGSSVLARGMDILRFVSSAGRPVTVPEIVDALQLPKPSAHRICKALTTMGLLARDIHPKKLNVGPEFTGMALAALSSTTALGMRRAILRQVVEEAEETCTLTVLEFDEVVFLDRVESASPLRLQLFAGSRVPLHCTSAGKLFLAMMPAARCDRLIRGSPLKRYTENTITDPVRLRRELDEIRQEQLGRDHQEFIDGLEAIAAPVLDPRGRMVAAVSINGPATRLRVQKQERHVEVLRRAAAALAASFQPESESRRTVRRHVSR